MRAGLPRVAMLTLALCAGLPSVAPQASSAATETQPTTVQTCCVDRPRAVDWIESVLKRFEWHGELRQETAYRVSSPTQFTKLRQQLLLTESARFNESVSVRATQRAYYDALYRLSNTYPETVEANQEWLIEPRETYLDVSRGPFDVRLGKQQIVWGDAVGLFFADIVNAKDLREYILPDFDLIRIPQWAADVEATAGSAHAEFVWIPERRFHRLGVSSSEFEFLPPVPAGSAFSLIDPSKPPSSVDNSAAGLRLSYLLSGWDVSGFYLYGWDNFPVPFRTIEAGVYRFAPRYERRQYLGGSFSKDLGAIVFKGELLCTPHASLATFDTRDADGIVTRSTVDYLLGVDHTFFGRLETNVQLLQRIVTNHDTLLVNEDRTRTHVSIWLKTSLFGGTVEPELLFITRLSEADLLYRPKLTMNLTGNLRLRAGADVLRGKSSGLFGRFDKRSRVYAELSYLF